ERVIAYALTSCDVGVVRARAVRCRGVLPGAGGGAVAVQDFAAVGVPGGGGAVGVQDQGPAPPVDHDLVVEKTQQDALPGAGVAAVGFVLDVVHLARGGGLGAAAGPAAVLVPEHHRVADPGRDRAGVPDVQRQAPAGQPRAQLAGAQEAGQPAGTGQ